MKKKVDRKFLTVASAIVIILALLLLGFCTKQEATEKTTQPTSTQSSSTTEKAKNADYATISIKNGASDANSNYAVNGLHVYDPKSKDLEDFVDGAEVKVGSDISIYVYNLASDVHLYIEHDGKVVVDKDYSVLKDEKDVEFFDFKVKGDIKVITSVVNSKAAQKIAPVYINNDQLATLSVDGKETETGAELAYGSHDFTVTAADKDIISTVKVADKVIKEVTIKAGQSYTYKNVAVDNTVFVHYEYANKADAKAAAAASASATNGGNKTAKVAKNDEEGHVVYVNNQTSEQLDIRYLDDNMNVHTVSSGTRYVEKLEIYSRVINTSSRRLLLTASLNGQVVDSTYIEPKPENDDATYFGLESIKLTGDLTYTLTYADGGNASSPTNPSQTKNKGQGQNAGGVTPSNPASPSNPSTPAKQTPTTKPATPSSKTATITINDGAKSANTDYAVNGLHVYSPGYNNDNDFKSGAKVAIGTKLTIFEYNLASGTHLTVIHNGKVIADKDYDILTSDADVDFIEFTVEGDVQVISSVGKKGTSLPTPTPSLSNYKVTIDNKVAQALVNVSYIDTSTGVAQAIKVQSGSSVAKGTGIFTQVLNPTSDTLRLTVYVGNKVVGTTTIAPKPANEDYAAGGLMGDNYQGILLTGDMRIVVEKEVAAQTFSTISEAANYVKSQMLNRQSPISLYYEGITTAQVKEISRKIMAQAFAHTGVGNEGDYLRYSMSGYTTSTNVDDNLPTLIKFDISYNTTLEQENTLTEKLVEIEQSLDVANKSDYEKAKVIYDWICRNVAYDWGGTPVLKNTAYAAVLNYLAQCEGYATLYYRMANDLGLDTRLLAGTLEGIGHAWNISLIDGKWYNIDTTHGSQIGDEEKEITEDENTSYFFLKGAENFSDRVPFKEYKTEEFASESTDYVRSASQPSLSVSEQLEVYNSDNQLLKNGASLSAGQQTFYVYDTSYSFEDKEVSLSVDGKVVATAITNGYGPAVFNQINVTGPVEISIEKPSEKATITINDGAKAANTSTAVNGLHVYSPGYNNLKDFDSGDRMPIGTKISVYEYNYSTPVRIQIVMNGKTIVDKVQQMVTSDKDVEFFDFELTGDVVITTSVAETSEQTPKLTIENSDLGYVYNADTYQEYTDQANLSLGSTNLTLYAGKDAVDVTVSVAGTIVKTATIAANKSLDLKDLNVTGDVKITFVKAATPSTYAVRVTGDAKDAISVTEGTKTYTDAGQITAGAHQLAIYNSAYDTTTYTITIKVDGKEVAKGTAFEYVSFDAAINVTGDVEIIAEKQTALHTVTVTGNAADKVTLYRDATKLKSREQVEEGTVNFYFYAADDSDETTYTVTLKKNGQVIDTKTVIGAYYQTADFEKFLLDDDIEFEVTQ